MQSGFFALLWQLYLEAAPYLVVGFAVAGVLHQFLPPKFVQKHLGGDSLGNIMKASLIGTPVPLCSCGVVPVGIGLHKDGASKATSVSFLIATPENGVESISLTYSFFGLPFTVARIVFAILVANITALGVAFFGGDDAFKASAAPKVCCGSQKKTESESPRDGFRFVVEDFVPSIARWVVIGFLLSAALGSFLPAELLTNVDPIWAVPLAGLVGIPLYVCASASTPIAFSLFMNGLSPGACLVFLLTGPATNSANFPVYLKAFGTRTTAIYYSGIYLVSVVLGLLFDTVLRGPELLGMEAAGHHHFEPGLAHYGGAVVLGAMLLYGLWLDLRPKLKSSQSGCCS